MAHQSYESMDPLITKDLRSLLWGSSVKDEVFSRWTQGFLFSDETLTALVQYEGGPCAVIVPVQAFIVKCALFAGGEPNVLALTAASSERAKGLLVAALCEILVHVKSSEFILVSLDRQSIQSALPCQTLENSHETGSSLPQDALHLLRGSQHFQEFFHSNLLCSKFSNEEDLHAAVMKALPDFQSPAGVLLYLYSVVLTKGIKQIKNEVEDLSEPLIDNIFGHGSQSLINLLLTSQATSNVWDKDKEVSGLKLRGIQQQPTIGFLTLLEHLQYCEVGWFYKNPKFPIWLLASETHLTLLFSPETGLLVRDSPATNAQLVFAQFDPEGNGFIPISMLEDVMRCLNLVVDDDYIEIIKKKLDSEGLEIITRSSFLEEFFPEPMSDQLQSFTIYHYNGLPQSCPAGKVTLTEGTAFLAEVETPSVTDSSPIKLCLQTKWPTIQIDWTSSIPPSLN